MLKPLFLALALCPVPALADTLTGADDPQFQNLVTRLLTADDSAAVKGLYDLAVGGNTAALALLPLAEGWVPAQGSFTEKKKLRQIDGQKIEDLAAKSDPVAALWQGGTSSQDLPGVIARALDLYQQGEPRKADTLLSAASLQDPTMALPSGFVDLPADPRMLASMLEYRMNLGDGSVLPILQTWLDTDRIEGWIVMAILANPDVTATAKALAAEIKLPPDAAARIADGVRIISVTDLTYQHPPPVPAETVSIVLRDLMPRPQFAPVRAYCEARCPTSAAACEAAFVTLLGVPLPSIEQASPIHDTISEAEFFASPRGEQMLLGPALFAWNHRNWANGGAGYSGPLQDNPAFQTARTVDACFAEGALRASEPLPAAP